MKRTNIIFSAALLFCALAASGAEQRFSWSERAVWVEPEKSAEVAVHTESDVPGGGPVLEVKTSGKKSQIWLNNNLETREGTKYRLSFQAKSSTPGKISVGAYQSGGKWAGLGKPSGITAELETQWKQFVWEFTGQLNYAGQFRIPAINFAAMPAGSVVSLGTVTLETLSEPAAEPAGAPLKREVFDWGKCLPVFEPAGCMEIKVAENTAVPGGGSALEVKVQAKKAQLWLNNNLETIPGTRYRLTFQAKASAAGSIHVGSYRSGGDWATLGVPVGITARLDTEWKQFVWEFTGKLDCNGQFRLPAINFDGMPQGSVVSLGAMTFDTLSIPAAPAETAPPQETQLFSWDKQPTVEPVNCVETRAVTPADLPGGGTALEVKVLEKKSQIWFSTDVETNPGIHYRLTFQAKASVPGRITVGAYQSGGKWAALGAPASYVAEVGTEWRKFVWEFTGKLDYSGQFRLPAFNFDAMPTGSVVTLGPVTLDTVSGKVDKYPNRVTIKADEVWKELDLSDLYVRKGSALDLSDLVERVPAGTYGRVIAGANGRTVFEKKPDQPVRFLGYSFTPDINNIGRTKEGIAAFADALATQGYNIVRFHGVENLLISRHRFDGNFYDDPETIPFIPENEDAFQYFVYCLKQRGIYIYLDLATFASGWTTADIWGGGPEYYKARLISGDEKYRKNYRAGILRLLTQRNPYTGTTLAEDPVLAFVLFYNEQNLRWSSLMPKVMHQTWIAYLKKKYGTVEKLRAAWKDVKLPENLTWENVPEMSEKATQSASVFAEDMAGAILDAELETTRWFESLAKEANYKGLTSQWDFIYRLGEVVPRATQPTISMHAYHAHPSNYVSPGSFCGQASVLSSGCSLMRVLAPVRMIDRPYLVTEYGIVFWNRFRHEQGLVSAYGALQEWDLLMVHASTVLKNGGPVRPFRGGDDLPIRASEVVTAFAFLRGDVAPAKNTIVFPMDDAFIFQGNRPFSAFNGNLAFLATISRFGIQYGPMRADVKADLVLPPLGDATFNDFGAYGAVQDGFQGAEELNRALAEMRAKKLLGPENITDPAAGVYQSDTGEITMRLKEGSLLDVVTPRLEGTTIKENKVRKLDALTVSSASCPAAVTVIARTGEKAIPEADRLLVVIGTDSVNSNMSFADATRNVLLSIGEMPVLAESGRFELRIRNTGVKNPVCYAIKLNGERADRVAVARDGDELVFSVDTAQLPQAGVTPFFEIVSE